MNNTISNSFLSFVSLINPTNEGTYSISTSYVSSASKVLDLLNLYVSIFLVLTAVKSTVNTLLTE